MYVQKTADPETKMNAILDLEKTSTTLMNSKYDMAEWNYCNTASSNFYSIQGYLKLNAQDNNEILCSKDILRYVQIMLFLGLE